MSRTIPFGAILICGSLLFNSVMFAEDEVPAIEPAAVDLGRPVDFERDIYPILDANCIACHNLAIDESQLSVEDVESVLKGGKRGPSVVPKEPEKSLLYLFASRQKKPAMPPPNNDVEARALTPKQLGLIRQWILEGANQGSGGGSSALVWSPVPSNMKAVYSVAMTPWSRYAAVGRSNQISIYDLTSGREIAVLSDPELQSLQIDGEPMYRPRAAHRDLVHSLAFNSDGTLLASGGYRVVRLWQRQPNSPATIAVPDAVRSLAVSADRKWLALGLENHLISLVNLADGKIVHNLSGHTALVTGVAFVSDGSRLVSGSHDKTIRMWNLADGSPAGQWETPSEINDLIVNKEGNRVVTAEADNVIRSWDPAAATKPPAEGEEQQPVKPLVEMKGHGKPVTALELLPNGSQLISGSEDGTLRHWDLNNGRNYRSMTLGAPITDVAARPDGQFVAACGSNGVARIWQLSNGRQTAEFKGQLNSKNHLRLSEEESTVAQQKLTIADNNVKNGEKNVKDREEALKKASEAKEAADKAVTEAEKKANEADEKLAAAKAELEKKPDDKNLQKKVADAQSAADKENAALKVAKDSQQGALKSKERAEKSVETAKAEFEQVKKLKTEAETFKNERAAQLEAAKKADQESLKPFRSIAYSPDGKSVITVGDEQPVQKWNADNGQPVDVVANPNGPLTAVKYLNDGRIVTASPDKSVALWNIDPTWELIARLGTNGDDPMDVGESPFVHRVLSLDFNFDGTRLVTGGGEPSRSGELMVWDVAERKLIREFEDAHSDTVMGVEFSRDGKYIVSGASDKFVKLFDVETGDHLRSFEGHTNHVLDVSIKADNSKIVSAGADNVIKVWNTWTGEQIRTISGYSKQVTSIEFIGINDNVVSCSGDRAVKFHQLNNGRDYRRFNGSGDFVYAVDVSRVDDEQGVVIAGGEDGIVRVWNAKSTQVQFTFNPPAPPEVETTAATE